VQATFGSSATIDGTSKEELTKGLMSIHAFHDRLRYKGGTAQLPIAFWKENNEDAGRVRRTLKYLLYGGGDFIERLHDVLYDQGWNLKGFGISCAMELYGTIKPDEFPPVNFRIAKALRFLGFDVLGA
jgi:hypothetical protein